MKTPIKTYVVISRNINQAQAHFSQVLDKIGESPVLKTGLFRYEGHGWTMFYASHPDKVRGLRNFKLIKVGEWYKNEFLDEFETLEMMSNVS